MSLDYETECRELTWSITDHTLLLNHVPEKESLEPGERSTNPEINFLTNLHCIRETFVWSSKLICSSFDLRLGQGREVCSIDVYVWLNLSGLVYDIEANRFSFTIAISPNLQCVNVLTVLFDVLHNHC